MHQVHLQLLDESMLLLLLGTSLLQLLLQLLYVTLLLLCLVLQLRHLCVQFPVALLQTDVHLVWVLWHRGMDGVGRLGIESHNSFFLASVCYAVFGQEDLSHRQRRPSAAQHGYFAAGCHCSCMPVPATAHHMLC